MLEFRQFVLWVIGYLQDNSSHIVSSMALYPRAIKSQEVDWVWGTSD